MPGITIASAYGTGGDEIAARVSAELGYQLLGRAINAEVAKALNAAEDEVASGAPKLTFGKRLARAFLPAAQNVLGTDAGTIGDSTEFRIAAEKVMHDALAGGAVILGRSGAAAMQDRADVLRVRVYGEVEERIAWAMRQYGVTEAAAREEQEDTDRARIRYWQRMYGIDAHPADQRWYHLQLRTTQLDLDKCVHVILDAYRTFIDAGDASGS